jgi:hypothetical protein
MSWRTAHRQLRSEAAARHLDLGEYLATSSDPTPAAVFLEDSAALIGIALALAALVLHITTGLACGTVRRACSSGYCWSWWPLF